MHFKSTTKIYISLNIRHILSLSLIFYTLSARAQFFSSEQNPPSLRWRQIKTENFQVIYPQKMETEAQRMANTLEHIIPFTSKSLGRKPKPIAVILQNQGTSSNGFVQLAPRRSEFFTTPPQEYDFQDWLNSLAVHETRHVAQFDKLTGYVNAPVFESLGLAIFGITLPTWFYEGDAVGIETALTKAGRGRQPEWNITFRTNLIDNKKYSYSKDFLGSVKDLTPGYYQLGYYLTTKLKRDYGIDIMDSIYMRMKRNPFRPYNLSNSIKKFTGLSTRQLHDSTAVELRQLWSKQLNSLETSSYPIVNNRNKKTPGDYRSPFALASGGRLLFLKESKDRTASISVLENGKEHRILNIGIQEEPNLNYSHDLIAWDETRFDTRFQQRSFNVVNVYDLRKKKYRQLTHRSRLFAPAISPAGDTIIAVDISYKNEISLVELDAKSGRTIRTYKSPKNYMLQTPAYNQTGEKVVVVAVSQEGKTLLELDRKSGKFTQILPFERQLISHPAYAGKDVLYKAHYNGIDNIYCMDRSTGKVLQVTSARFGTFYPSYDSRSRRIYFSQYNEKGLDLSYTNYKKDSLLPVHRGERPELDYIGPVVRQEGNQDVFDSIPDHHYPAKKYRELSHLFYFHSVLPIFEENNYDNYNFGLKLQSDNKLNTLSLYTGYRYNNALRRSEYLSGFTYSKYYPILDLSYVNQARLTYSRLNLEGTTVLIPVEWRENLLDADITIPVVFNRLNNNFSTGFKAGTSFTSRYDIENRPDNFIDELRFPLHYQLYFFQNNRRSARDLAPRFGQNLTVTYRHFPFEKQVKGELLTIKSNLYFPGFFSNHSLQISFNYQHGLGSYRQTNDIPLVSGYSFLKPVTSLRNTLLVDYRFPLFYPDLELGPLAYIKRLKGGFFSDFQNVGKGNSFSPQTFGAELRADMNLLRFYLPNFDIGGKIIFVNEKPRQNPIFETIVSYTF